jgi:hypothetical protein
MIIGSVAAFKLFVAIVLYLFLPFTALTSTSQRDSDASSRLTGCWRF